MTRSGLDYRRTIHVARVLCVFFMMYAHDREAHLAVLSWNAAPAFILWLHSLLYEHLSRLSVPLLSVVSGWLFASTFKGRLGPSVAGKVRTLLVPMLAWNLITVAAFLLGQQLFNMRWSPPDSAMQWLNQLFALTTEPADVPLYFVRDLFLASVIGAALLAANSSRAVLWTAVLLAAALVILLPLRPLLLRPSILLQFLLGIACQRTWNLMTPRATRYVAMAGLALLALHLLTPEDQVRAGTISLRLSAAALGWVVIVLIARMPLAGWLAKLSPVIFITFCSHILTFKVFGRIAQELTGARETGPVAVVTYFIGPVVALAMGWLLHHALQRWAPGVLAVLEGDRTGKYVAQAGSAAPQRGEEGAAVRPAPAP